MKYLSILFFVFLLASCNQNTPTTDQKQKAVLKIAITKASGSRGSLQYGKWLKSIDTLVQIFDLYLAGRDSALKILENCDALLVSGGADVHPNNYGEKFDSSRCEQTDPYRDSLELSAIDYAIRHQMPVLGICRGEQILNVYFGGSLYQDIPTDKPQNTGHRRTPIDSNFHAVYLTDTSVNLLYDICHSNKEMVNSAHHQAIKSLGNQLMILAFAEDSIPESISWKNPKGQGFLLGVQWHPEWLDSSNRFSYPIGERFLNEAGKYQKTKERKK
jgi:gamma-glutamyl-gamma-aminobutyrate hydrolase PuuD